jgi:hypothetical protein
VQILGVTYKVEKGSRNHVQAVATLVQLVEYRIIAPAYVILTGAEGLKASRDEGGGRAGVDEVGVEEMRA